MQIPVAKTDDASHYEKHDAAAPKKTNKLFQPAAMSPKQGAQFIGCSVAKFYELLASGDLKARKIGRRTIVLRSDLEAFLHALPAFKSEASGAQAA